MQQTNKQTNKHLILTALDDNTQLWYENFIPFVLSLRKESADYDIGVIDYGLSERKKAILAEQNIQIFPSTNECQELLLDRHLSTAQIANNTDYENVAIFDADIWFPHYELTVFQQINDPKSLYATYDVFACTFLTQCVKEDAKQTIKQKINLVKENNRGSVWQAGAIVGSAQAWQNYREYCLSQLTNYDSPFLQEYGIDATLLNLYQLDTNQVRHISAKYNCVPAWGVRIKSEQGRIKFDLASSGEPIEALHITRNYRKDNNIIYPAIHSHTYYQEGKAFQLSDGSLKNFAPESFAIYPTENSKTLKLTSAKSNAAIILSEEHNTQGINIQVGGESEIFLLNEQQETLRIICYYMPVFNKTLCNEIFITYKQGYRFSPVIGRAFYVDLAPQESLSLHTQDLDQEHSVVWTLENVRLTA
ncbi:hypothetical protein [Avibacterium avium]|uniref:hypothetical protein n=1 Tax=Avibacterium avium TaxID=751 RepID=UPI003BF8CAF1